MVRRLFCSVLIFPVVGSPSPNRLYIVFGTVANRLQTREDTYSKFSAEQARTLKWLKQNDLE
jgi:hypothetical protein